MIASNVEIADFLHVEDMDAVGFTLRDPSPENNVGVWLSYEDLDAIVRLAKVIRPSRFGE
jgi:hypothetical protein